MLGAVVDLVLASLGFDPRTSMYLKFDLRRLCTRVKHHRDQLKQGRTKLHMGAGARCRPTSH
jgi:hypothetical protein